MAAAADLGGLFSLYPAEVPQALTVAHQGLQYKGEVVLSEHWDPAWGHPLEGDVYFRVVLLEGRRRVPPADIQDSRIAVCIPSRGRPRARGNLERELTAIREAQALYLTQRRPETDFVRSYVEKQRDELEQKLLEETVARYASGLIESPTSFGEDIGEFFSDPSPESWLRKVAGALLSWAYPVLPIEPSLMPEEIPAIYYAMFASRVEEGSALVEYGPGLGLSRPQAPLAVDPSDCQVFLQIRGELESHQGEISWQEVHPALAHSSGLTRPLASLYLLAFAAFGHSETELNLAPGHSLRFRDGRAVRGNRLTREFLGLLPWQEDDDTLAQSNQSLCLPQECASWNDALQYASLLCQGLTEAEDASPDVPKQEKELLDTLGDLAADTEQAVGVLDALSAAIRSPNEQEVRFSLQCLWEVCQGDDFRKVYASARGVYANPADLSQGLELLRSLLYLGESLDEIVGAFASVDSVDIASGYPLMSFERVALLEEMSLPVLLAAGQGWSTVRVHIREYQSRYRRAYLEHHARYQLDACRLWALLEDSRTKARALGLLNSVPELGEPVGLGLDQRCTDLELETKRCDISPEETAIDMGPRCANCRMALGANPPTHELDLCLRDLDRALTEQNRRLSRVVVDRVLHDKVDRRLDNFLKIVQASDTSALSNTLDDELAGYIRQLLQSS